jgi:hypothetical protein
MRRLVALWIVAGCAAPAAAPPPREPEVADEAYVEDREAFEGEAPLDIPQRVPEPEALPLPTEDLAEAWKLAEQAFVEGEYATAAGYFKSIYEREPYPEALHAIATCLKQLDDCYGAVRYYDAYLAAAPAAKNRATVEQRLTELRVRCPDDGNAEPTTSE